MNLAHLITACPRGEAMPLAEASCGGGWPIGGR
jgi:hypothetical protein